MRYTHYDKHKKRWQINADYGAVMIDELNYAVGEAIDKLAAYEDAEEQGRMVILPCAVKDAVYYINPDDIGKTVFLSRADAEAALKGGQDDGTA